MKKISVIAMAFLAAVSIQTVAVAASIGVKSDNASVSYTYSTENEAVFDAEKLFSKLDEVSVEDGITDTFVITSNADSEDGIEVLLRLEVESASDSWTYSPLDYYSFTISDQSGNVIYDSADADLSAVSDTSKDISLGVFNNQLAEDTKSYTVEYKLSEAGAKDLSPEDVSGLTISLVAIKSVEIPVAEETVAEPTAKPKFEIPTVAPMADSNEIAATEVPETTSQPVETETEKPVKEKKLVCGTDIDAGRYVVKGNGIVKVESELGVLESEAMLNDDSVAGVEGEDSAIITLSEGDVVTLLPLEGQEKATVSLEKTNSGSSASGSTATRDNVTNSETGKTNPKTGEESTIALGVVMILAVVGISALEIVKRKRVK